MKPLRIQFFVKRREAGPYGSWSYEQGIEEGRPTTLSSGLRNSVLFIVDMLVAAGIDAKITEVQDNNDIDREVSLYKPTHAIIEAFWVVPEKFDILKPLHKHVKWFVRSHSQSEFLSLEGMAFSWAVGYLQRGVGIMANSKDAVEDFKALACSLHLSEYLVTYLPNYYPLKDRHYEQHHGSAKVNPINIGCFGAIRPLKNHLVQALSAIQIAHTLKRDLNFHVNGTRTEGNADPILRNLRSLFDKVPGTKLVEHEWMEHEDFLTALTKIDLSLQVSFSETFNIVAADSVAVGVPLIGSAQIPWLPNFACANPNSAEDITAKGLHVFQEFNFVGRFRLLVQKHHLNEYVTKARETWLDWAAAQRHDPEGPRHPHHFRTDMRRVVEE